MYVEVCGAEQAVDDGNKHSKVKRHWSLHRR